MNVEAAPFPGSCFFIPILSQIRQAFLLDTPCAPWHSGLVGGLALSS